MTSANAYNNVILKDGVEIASYHENVLCKINIEKYLKHTPFDMYEIRQCGYDENEEYWESEPIKLGTWINKWVKTSKHHLFTYHEVRKKLVEVFGEPSTPDEHKFIHSEIKRVRMMMPQYDIPHEKHMELHKND